MAVAVGVFILPQAWRLGSDAQVLDEALGMLTQRFGLAHATLQAEVASGHRCDDLDR